MAGGGYGDFHLADETLAVIPIDPYEQLDLARKITAMAIAARVSKLELHNARLEEKLAGSESAVLDLQARLRVALDENAKLSSERDAMSATIKKLSRDLAKLETLKRQLMQSLNGDSSPTGAVDIGTNDQSVAKTFVVQDEGSNGNITNNDNAYRNDAVQHDEGSNGNITNNNNAYRNDAVQHARQKISMSPYITPQWTPGATPKVISTGVSPRGYSAAASPKNVSKSSSPTKHHSESRATLPPWYPPSAKSSAPSSPPRGRPGRPPKIDGKEFFCQARNQLSYEQFGAFLANIKELNAHKQSREETLRKTEEIFGTDNKDLYLSFQGLLNRSAS